MGNQDSLNAQPSNTEVTDIRTYLAFLSKLGINFSRQNIDFLPPFLSLSDWFSEPDKNMTKGAVEWRWFERAGKLPFCFAGIWRPWTGDRGTKRAPNIGDHMLFSIMTMEPNGVVEAVHEKAMPVMLMTPDDVAQWLSGASVEDAMKMQKPAPDEAVVMRPPEKKAA